MASIPTQGQGAGGTTAGAGGATAGESPGATDQARERAGEVAGQAQEKAQQVAGQAGEQARQARDQASHRARQQVEERSTRAGEQVSGQARDIRTVAEKLREEGKDRPAQLAEQAADRVERVGSYLTESDADRILGDVEDFARRRPWAVVAGGLALGFAASRLLKASSQERYYRSEPQQLPNRTDRPAGTTPPAGSPPLSPIGNGGGERTGAGPVPTTGGPPTSTGAL